MPTDDTYMYDDAARGAIRPHQIGHWYDEPPYESDPDDFLMSGINSGPAATIQVYTIHCTVSIFPYFDFRQGPNKNSCKIPFFFLHS